MNQIRRAKLRRAAFLKSVEAKRARYRADAKRLDRPVSRGSHSGRNGCWPGKYGAWGRMTERQKTSVKNYITVFSTLKDRDDLRIAMTSTPLFHTTLDEVSEFKVKR